VEDIEAIVGRMRVEDMDIPELAAWAREELVSEFGHAPRRAARGFGACVGRMQRCHILCSTACAGLENGAVVLPLLRFQTGSSGDRTGIQPATTS
jgi:hypothetical protein